MPSATMTYVLSHIMQNIPSEILNLAFQPRRFSTTIEQRIIGEVIAGPVLLDTNLIGGKRREIFVQSDWQMDVRYEDSVNVVGSGEQGSFYLIPSEFREDRNIASVIGITPYLGQAIPGSGVAYGGQYNSGNTATGLLSQMLNTHTMGQYPVMPHVTLEGTNIIKFYPELAMGGISISVMLEYDAEFLNMNQSSIMAMRNLCLCAVQRYIATKLRLPIDETEIVGGLELGAVKEIVMDYQQKAEQYYELLIKLKGAMQFHPDMMRRIISYAL